MVGAYRMVGVQMVAAEIRAPDFADPVVDSSVINAFVDDAHERRRKWRSLELIVPAANERVERTLWISVSASCSSGTSRRTFARSNSEGDASS
jgi:hypothetical protein